MTNTLSFTQTIKQSKTDFFGESPTFRWSFGYTGKPVHRVISNSSSTAYTAASSSSAAFKIISPLQHFHHLPSTTSRRHDPLLWGLYKALQEPPHIIHCHLHRFHASPWQPCPKLHCGSTVVVDHEILPRYSARAGLGS